MEIKSAEVMALEKLSPREREVAEAIHSGVPRKDIARSMGISPGTLQTYLENIYRKFDVGSVQQMVLVVERAKVAAQ